MTLRGQGRFVCSNHVGKKTCSNAASIAREKLETRVLDGVRDRLMTPEIAAEAIRAYVEESNRLNHQRRASEGADRSELAKIDKAISGILDLAEQGKGTRALLDRLVALEATGDVLRARLAAQPTDTPDVHPNIAEIYRRKVERLARSLDHPEEQDEAADALRGLIERVTLLPGKRRGEMNATLQGEFGAILEWVKAQEQLAQENMPGANLSSVALSVVEGSAYDRSRPSSLPRMSGTIVAGTVPIATFQL